MWQICILLWKHTKARLRNYKRLLAEILFPSILFVLVFSIRLNISASRCMETAHYTEAINQDFLLEYSNIRNIYYSSNNSDFTNDLMKEVAKKLNVDSVTGYHNKNDLMALNEQNLKKNKFNLAVIFKNDNNSLQYSIHSSEKYEIFKTAPSITTAGPHENYGRIYEKFASLQIAIDTTFIEMKSKNASLKKIHVQSFPYPPYIRNEGCNMKYNIIIPFLIINSYFVVIVSIMDDIFSDQKSGIKELMVMMGLKRCNYWIAHFLNNIIVQISICLIYILILKIGSDALIPNTNGFILLLTFFGQSIYVILFTFMICSFFSEVCLAALIGFTIWILTQVLRDPCLNETTSFIQFVLPNVAISKMMNIVGYHEIQGDGLQFENLFTTSERFPESYIYILAIQFMFSFIFGIVFLFMESLNPRSHWERITWVLKNLKPRKTTSTALLDNDIEMNTAYFDAPLPPDAEIGIEIKGVSKIYMSWEGYAKKALSNISINIYKSGITALLGHNGAGKTTLMSIITGMQSATVGKIDYHKSFTKHIGICPQENIVIEQLTVKENVIFFGMIKGLSKIEAEEESDTILKKLDLSDKKNSFGKDLSGGGQRRLQLALAISGNSSVLVLDEPTSRLDAKMKREVWDKLLSLRESHTILITTHLMEEAEILGDRIAILNHGQIKCYGTPNCIKRKICPYYKLNVLTEQTDKTSIKNHIREFFPISKVEDESDNLVQFVLNENCKKTLYESLDRIKNRKKSLGIESFSLLEPTMEEGYLRICHGISETTKVVMNDECNDEYSTNPSFLIIVCAFMTNRFLFIKRRSYMFFTQIIFAILLFLFAALYKADTMKNHNEDPMKIDLSIYNQSNVHILYSSFTNDSSLERWIKMNKVPFEYISGDMEKS